MTVRDWFKKKGSTAEKKPVTKPVQVKDKTSTTIKGAVKNITDRKRMLDEAAGM